MPLNKLYLSTLNPIKFVQEGYANPDGQNTKFKEDFRYQETIRSFEQPMNWFQPWQNSDTITIQLLSNFAPFLLELYTCDGRLIDAVNLTYVPSSIETTGVRVWQISKSMAAYPRGNYFFRLQCGSPLLLTLISEVFSLSDIHDLSVLLRYKHDKNDHDSVFENGLEFSFRVPGGLTEYKPASDRTVFIDQPRDIVQLSGRSFSTEKLIVGTAEGVPDWVAQRITDIFLCSFVSIDGRQYVANEGANMEPERIENYPMSGWAFEVRPAKARSSKLFEADPVDIPSSVVFQLETRGFGTITTGSDTTQIPFID